MKVNLFLLKKDGTKTSFSLASNVTLIGRRQDCDLSIPLSIVSRKHCEICVEQNKLMIRDLHSKNGTFVNGQKVEEMHLNPGDRLSFGPVIFVVQIDGAPAADYIIPLTPARAAQTPPAAPETQAKSEDHFDEFSEDLKNLHPSSSHTAEIPDIIDDLATPGT
jgi:pSer/pThr/pTyr-binding forkhead associated (FHA) protein